MQGKVAIVTGGARGLGGAAASALAAEGAAVVIADILEAEGEAKAAEIASSGGRALFTRLDVREEQAWARVVDEAVTAFGGVDVLVNNAGVSLPRTIEDATLEEFRRVMDINLYGPFLGMKAALPAMTARGGGSIVNVSSNSTEMIVPTTTYYAASKAALANLTKTAAVRFATQNLNIRVNSIHPGPHATDMIDENVPHIRQMRDTIPLGRFGRPEEFGQLVVFLASGESSYMTAAEFFTDGGLTRVSYAVERG
jgi:3alpha(or 20beta)-hydroxysteroid dehydrogenase